MAKREFSEKSTVLGLFFVEGAPPTAESICDYDFVLKPRKK